MTAVDSTNNGTTHGIALEAPPPVVAVPPAAGPRAPHIEDWIEVPGYPGHQARVWVNFPQRLLAEIQSGDQETAKAAMCRVVLEHNGWCDEDGKTYPPASDPAFWEAIPTHQAAAIIAAVNARATTNPLAKTPR